jgi:hypothetical protein
VRGSADCCDPKPQHYAAQHNTTQLNSTQLNTTQTQGLNVSGGSACGAVGCDIYGNGDAGVVLDGGNRTDLTPSSHFVRSSTAHSNQRWILNYAPSVLLAGVGQTVDGMEVYNSPQIGLFLQGNDHVVNGSDFHHLALECSDCGAFCELVGKRATEGRKEGEGEKGRTTRGDSLASCRVFWPCHSSRLLQPSNSCLSVSSWSCRVRVLQPSILAMVVVTMCG